MASRRRLTLAGCLAIPLGLVLRLILMRKFGQRYSTARRPEDDGRE